jgi:hypothetical protein
MTSQATCKAIPDYGRAFATSTFFRGDRTQPSHPGNISTVIALSKGKSSVRGGARASGPLVFTLHHAHAAKQHQTQL